MKIAGGTTTESYRLYALAGGLLLGGPVWHYLYVNHYPFSRPEAVVLVVAAALVGAVASVAAHKFGGVLESLIFAGLLYGFVDLQFELQTHLPLLVLVALCLVLSLTFRGRRALLVCLTLGAFYLASLPRRAVGTQVRLDDTPGRTELPLVVHIILDEQWGIGGLRAEGEQATADFLSDFYVQRGFEVYEAAYSRFNRTIEAIPDLVSMGRSPRLDPVDPRHQSFRSLESIPYFELLAQRGYRIRVYQNSYLNFCRARESPVAYCETQAGNSIASIGQLSGTWTARAYLAARYLVGVASDAYRRIHPDPDVWRRSSVGGGIAALRHLRDAIARHPAPGTAFFVHVLLPHRPLEVDATCAPIANPAHRVGFGAHPASSDSAWRETLHLESSQIRCAHRIVADVIAAIDSTVGKDGAIVLVHGDHGGRIFQRVPSAISPAQLDLRQLNGRYSTLLAIRRPGVAAAIHSDPVPVQDFVWALASSAYQGQPGAIFSHFVRSSRVDSVVTDSVRVLSRGEMLWAVPSSDALRHP